ISTASTYSLAQNVENLTLGGTGDISGTGNTLTNIIIGNSGNNTLSDGGGGTDTLVGGAGNDVYYVSFSFERVTEDVNERIAEIRTDFSNSIVSLPNIENLTLLGTGNISASGNSGNNIITGNAGNNQLAGNGGVDTLIGGLGDDTYFIDDPTSTVIENPNE